MEKIIKILLSILLSTLSLNVFAQATSLIVDNQTPGWLSSKINYGDQLTVEQLKVTGYINEDDVAFLKELENKKLRVLDLEDVNTVEGSKDNIMSTSFLSGFLKLQKLITPRNSFLKIRWSGNDYILDKYDYKASDYIKFGGDSIIIKGSCGYVDGDFESIYVDYTISQAFRSPGNNTIWPKKYIEVPQNAQSVTFNCTRENTISVVLPSSIILIYAPYVTGGNYYFMGTNPSKIQVIPSNYGSYLDKFEFNPDTVFVPIGLKEQYEEHFKKYIGDTPVIEMGPPANIYLSKKDLKTYVGDKTVLSAIISPADAFYKGIVWRSTNEEVATISQSGELIAKKYGSTEIIVCSNKDENIADTCTVNVYDHTTGIEISDDKLEINIGDSYSLSATTLPQNTSDNSITWSSSNNESLNVTNDGRIRALALGTYIIKAITTDGGYEAECVVTVVQPATSVKLDKHAVTIRVGSAEEIHATVYPENTTYKNVEWMSSNKTIAEVNESGLVTAKKAGVAIVKAVAVSNTEAEDSCIVTVLQPVTGIKLEETNIELGKIGEMKQLHAIVLPEDASDKGIKWFSTNTSICTVSSSGIVVAVGFGTAVITATSEDGGFVAVCIVNVIDRLAMYDLNGDGKVSTADIQVIINEMKKPQAEQNSKYDLNGDGKISTADIQMIINEMKM